MSIRVGLCGILSVADPGRYFTQSPQCCVDFLTRRSTHGLLQSYAPGQHSFRRLTNVTVTSVTINYTLFRHPQSYWYLNPSPHTTSLQHASLKSLRQNKGIFLYLIVYILNRVENIGEIARLEQFHLLSQSFQNSFDAEASESPICG